MDIKDKLYCTPMLKIRIGTDLLTEIYRLPKLQNLKSKFYVSVPAVNIKNKYYEIPKQDHSKAYSIMDDFTFFKNDHYNTRRVKPGDRSSNLVEREHFYISEDTNGKEKDLVAINCFNHDRYHSMNSLKAKLEKIRTKVNY